MPVIRKIVKIGNAKGITLPKDWFEWLKREYGEEPKEILMEIDREIRIKPIFSKRRGH